MSRESEKKYIYIKGVFFLSLEEKARELRREYKREWRRRNKERVKKYNDTYWAKKVLEAEIREKGGTNVTDKAEQ